MEVQTEEKKLLQWHPAFYAGIQIELKDEAKHLIFENEHQLGTKPMGIDVLIIKKEDDRPIRKNIGRIFRKHNIIEYKSPEDYLSIDDFYKVYGYTCFYKSDVEEVDGIKVEELTISLVCCRYPRKLICHLRQERQYEVNQIEAGIYYVTGDKIPIQILVTRELGEKENLWLRSLTDQLEGRESAERLIEEYKEHKENSLYKSMMDVIVRANRKEFQEVKDMCDALMELMKDELDAKKAEGERIGEERGEERGEKRGETRVNALHAKLLKAGRMEDVLRATEDKEYQHKLFEEFGL